jgi:hypothetical protein
VKTFKVKRITELQLSTTVMSFGGQLRATAKRNADESVQRGELFCELPLGLARR